MTEHPKLYEINTVFWLDELSREYGMRFTIGDIPKEKWDELKELGFDHIWFMGVWKRSKAGMAIFKGESEYAPFTQHINSILPGWTPDDLIGSPYSVASYEPDNIIGGWEDIDKARTELNKRGMGLILDYIPNHTAPDHPWVFENPEYYILGSKEDYRINQSLFTVVEHNDKTLYIMRGKDPYFPPWTDTLQLNYFNSELRNAMVMQLKKISEHCDGVRCDMAMLVLNDIFSSNWKTWEYREDNNMIPETEFWQTARQSVPDFLLIAEAYWDTEWRLQQLGFDYTYDKRLYDRLLQNPSGDIYRHLQADLSFQSKLVRFIENHDEKRSAYAFPDNKLRAAATLFTTLPGMKLYYHGQLTGKKIKTPVQLRREPAEDSNLEVKTFYEKLHSIAKNIVFRYGVWKLNEVLPERATEGEQLISYTWEFKEIIKLVVINITDESLEGRILLHNISPESDYIFLNELDGEYFKREGSDLIGSGFDVSLDAFQACIFNVTSAG